MQVIMDSNGAFQPTPLNQAMGIQQPMMILPQVQISLMQGRFIEMPASQPLHHRPMVLSVDPMSMAALQEATHGGLNITPMAIRDIANRVVNHAMNPMGQLAIANGWGVTRFSFFLLFRVETSGRVYHEVLTGFTDETAISRQTNAIDHNMRLFVNSHIRISEERKITHDGAQVASIVSGNSNVLRSVGIVTPDNQHINGDFSMRPSDLYLGWQRQMFRAQGSQVLDHRGQMGADSTNIAGLASDRGNVIPSVYLNKLLTGWAAASAAGSMDQVVAKESFMAATASAQISEADFSGYAIFATLKTNTSYALTGAFTLGELINAGIGVNWAGMEAPTWLPQGAGQMTTEFHPWGDYSVTTRIAHKLAHAIPATATASMMAMIPFSAVGVVGSNGMGASHQLIPEGQVRTIFPSPIDAQLLAKFKTLMDTAVLPEIINQFEGVEYYTIRGVYSIGGTVDVYISINGNPEVGYSAPNYCDSMNTGLIAASHDEVDAQAQMLKNLVTNTFVNVDASVIGQQVI